MKISRLHLDITGKCNLSCIYCYLSARFNESDKEIDLSKTMFLLNEANRKGITRFSISGGEPLNNPNFIEILNRLREIKSDVVLFTNLFSTQEDLIREIIRSEIISEMIVSLDGFNGHDVARYPSKSVETLRKIRLIKEICPNLHISVNTIIHKFNLKELPDLYWTLGLIGVDSWRIDFPMRCLRDDIFCDFEDVIKMMVRLIGMRYKNKRLRKIDVSMFKAYKSELEGKSTKDVKELIDLNLHPCQYFFGTLSVRQNGVFTLCPSLNLSMGNVNNLGNLDEIMNQFSLHPFFSLSMSSMSSCVDCRYLRLCGTGCRGDALDWCGDYHDADPISCSLMPLTEKYIIPKLSQELQLLYRDTIDDTGKLPKYKFKSQKEIINYRRR